MKISTISKPALHFFKQEVIEVLKPRAVTAGTVVIQEGDDGDDFFIVESGTFNIYQRGTRVADNSLGTMITTLKGTGAFGELALLFVTVGF